MPTFRSEVAQDSVAVELDTTNPLSAYVDHAFVPTNGGKELFDAGTFTNAAFSDPSSATNEFIYNSDGSVTATEPSGGVNTNAPEHYGLIHQPDEMGINDRDIIVIFDADMGNAGANGVHMIWMMGNNVGDYIRINVGGYGSGLHLQYTTNYNGTQVNIGGLSERALYAFRMNVRKGFAEVYKNGVLVDDSITGKATGVFHSLNRRYIGLGRNNDKGYANIAMSKEGADFTAEEIASIVSDPYQLFKTQEDEIREHYLKADGASGSTVTLPTPMGTTGDRLDTSQHWKLSFGYVVDGDVGKVHGLMDATFTSTASLIFRRSDGLFRLKTLESGQISALGMTPQTTGYHQFDIVKLEGSNNYEFYLNGELKDTNNGGGTATNTFSIDQFYLADGHIAEGGFTYVSFTDYVEPTNNRFYDFNQANSQPYVPELINGQHGTLVNFPVPSGYVRELDSHGGVEFDGSGQHAIFPASNVFSSLNWRIEFDVVYVENATERLCVLFGGDSYKNHIIFWSKTHVQVRVDSVSSDIYFGERELVDGQDRSFAIERSQSTLTFYEATDDGETVVLGTAAVSRTSNENPLDRTAKTSNFSEPQIVKRIKIQDFDDSTNDRNFDFTKAQGYTVADTVGGNDATLVGFNNVYYRPEASGELVGYLLPNASTSLTTAQNWLEADYSTVTIEQDIEFGDNTDFEGGFGGSDLPSLYYRNWVTGSDRVSVQWRGVRVGIAGLVPTGRFTLKIEIDQTTLPATMSVYANEILLGSVTKDEALNKSRSIRFTGDSNNPLKIYGCRIIGDGATLNSYDFTTGDADQIIDTVGGNHATIVNAPTSGYLPIVEKQVYTVGAGKDFDDLISWEPSATSEDYHTALIIYGVINGAGRMGSSSTLRGGLSIKGATEDATIIGEMDYRGGTSFLLENVTHKDGLLRQSFAGEGAFEVRNIVVDAQNITDNYFHCNDVGIFKNCLIKNLPITFTSDRAKLYNCIATKAQRADRAPFRNADTECYNCISFDNAGLDYESVSLGSNNISSDSSAADRGIGIQKADIETAFADPANGDYRIKQSYADANLVGAGWNGSDIASWAYYDDAVGTPGDEVSLASTLSAVADAVASIVSNKSIEVQDSAIADYANNVVKIAKFINSIEAEPSLASIPKKLHNTISSLESLCTDTLDISTIKRLSQFVQAIPSSELANKSTRYLEVANLSSAELQTVIKSQRSLSIVLDAVGNVSNTYLSDSITIVAVAVTLSAQADSSVETIVGKILSQISVLSEIDSEISVSKLTSTVVGAITSSYSEASKVLISKPTVSNISSASDLNNYTVKATPFSLEDSSISNLENYISVFKDVNSAILGSASTDLLVDISKLTVSSMDGQVLDGVAVKVNKELNNVVISSEAKILVLSLGNFEDSNIIVIDSKILIPDTTVTGNIKVPDIVISGTIKVPY